jgi:hypothetical protein
MRAPLRAALVAALSCLSSRARADAVAVAPAGPGQAALAVSASAGGIVARACAAEAGCAAAGGATVPVPDDVAPRLASASIRVVPLEGKRHLVRVDVPGETQGASWVLLVAAPPASAPSREPRVLFGGWTGAARGEEGEARTTVVVEDPLPSGARVLVGQRRDDVTLCGRPALVAARLVDPASLELARGASRQSLPEAERASAARLFARRLDEPLTAPAAPLLRATVASSAVERRFATLTDGDPSTAWSEAKADEGAGEFVAMASASEVGVTSLELVVRPAADVRDGAAPRSFFLVTPDRAFSVTMPEDAWAKPGARYAFDLPEPLRASCLAIVLDRAYGRADRAQVTIAELTAHTSYDGMTVDALAGALAGGGERAEGAAALLTRAGAPGVSAVTSLYPKLDPAGRALALDVLDAAPCEAQAPFFTDRLLARAPGPEGDREAERARDRLRRCARAAAPELARRVREAPPRDKVAAAAELALLAPDQAPAPVLEKLDAVDDGARRGLRAALGLAARRERAWPAFGAELAPARRAARSEVARIDLLRALGPQLARVEGASAAFDEAARAASTFRARYLLLGPAAALAASGDPAATAHLRAALRDPDARLRARALELAGPARDLAPDVVAAVADPEVRVREAALRALAAAPPAEPSLAAKAGPALAARLALDPWTFVRAAAADALAAGAPSPVVDRALAAALADASRDVRGRAASALGAHRATAFAPALRERADDADESLDVRARALIALGDLCDRGSIELWTVLARRAAAPSNEVDRRLGAASLTALAAVRPPDLASRLAPLLAKDAAPGVTGAAKAALAAPARCPAR